MVYCCSTHIIVLYILYLHVLIMTWARMIPFSPLRGILCSWATLILYPGRNFSNHVEGGISVAFWKWTIPPRVLGLSHYYNLR